MVAHLLFCKFIHSERMCLNKHNQPNVLLFMHTICFVSLKWKGVEFTVPNVSQGAMFFYRLMAK